MTMRIVERPKCQECKIRFSDGSSVCRHDGGPDFCAWQWTIVDDTSERTKDDTCWDGGLLIAYGFDSRAQAERWLADGMPVPDRAYSTAADDVLDNQDAMTAAPRVATNKYRMRVERWHWPSERYTKEQLERETGGVAEKIGDGWRVMSLTHVADQYDDARGYGPALEEDEAERAWREKDEEIEQLTKERDQWKAAAEADAAFEAAQQREAEQQFRQNYPDQWANAVWQQAAFVERGRANREILIRANEASGGEIQRMSDEMEPYLANDRARFNQLLQEVALSNDPEGKFRESMIASWVRGARICPARSAPTCAAAAALRRQAGAAERILKTLAAGRAQRPTAAVTPTSGAMHGMRRIVSREITGTVDEPNLRL
jgi:hypothetical protein